MSAGGSFFESKKFKNIMKYVYGWGAAVVIVGALFKIMHWPGADVMLIAGLSIEAVIFFLSAFEPLHTEIDWTLAYPELAGADPVDGVVSSRRGGGHGDAVSQQLDQMLSEAKIGPELIESLGLGFRSLSDQTSKMNDITDVSKISAEFAGNLKGASSNVSKLSESYAQAAESLSNFGINPEDGRGYGEQMKKMTDNLSQLNNLYEMQLRDTTSNLQAASQMSSGISDLLRNLNESVEDTKKYKTNIAELTTNLSALNTIYGNMLNAMNFKG